VLFVDDCSASTALCRTDAARPRCLAQLEETGFPQRMEREVFSGMRETLGNTSRPNGLLATFGQHHFTSLFDAGNGAPTLRAGP